MQKVTTYRDKSGSEWQHQYVMGGETTHWVPSTHTQTWRAWSAERDLDGSERLCTSAQPAYIPLGAGRTESTACVQAESLEFGGFGGNCVCGGIFYHLL